MKHLYFMRHGLSVMNQQGIFSGRTDTPLAPEGTEQAHAAGEYAKNLQIDCIVSSPMARALETAQIVAGHIGYSADSIIVSELFAEREFGTLEGTKYVPRMHMEGVEGVETAENIV